MSPQYNLTYANADSAVLKVDTTEANASTGRFSVRIASQKQYNSGLFVFDVSIQSLSRPFGHHLACLQSSPLSSLRLLADGLYPRS